MVLVSKHSFFYVRCRFLLADVCWFLPGANTVHKIFGPDVEAMLFVALSSERAADGSRLSGGEESRLWEVLLAPRVQKTLESYKSTPASVFILLWRGV